MITDILVRLDAVERKGEDPRFYFVWHKRLFNILLILLICNFVVWRMVALFAYKKPTPKNFIQNSDGKTVQLFSIDEPNYTNEVIEEWAENAVKTIYTVDYSQLESTARHEAQLRLYRPYFSDEGWVMFNRIFEETIVPKVKEKGLQISVAVDKAKMPPTKIGGTTVWTVKVPAMFAYATTSARQSKRVTIELVVGKQVTYTNPKGLSIIKINESN